jgi:hypothetical protein
VPAGRSLSLFPTQVGNQLAELSVLDEEGVDALISGLRDRLVGNEPTESLPEYVPKGAAIVQAAQVPRPHPHPAPAPRTRITATATAAAALSAALATALAASLAAALTHHRRHRHTPRRTRPPLPRPPLHPHHRHPHHRHPHHRHPHHRHPYHRHPQAARAEMLAEAGVAALKAAAGEPGAVQTASGLVVQVIVAG